MSNIHCKCNTLHYTASHYTTDTLQHRTHAATQDVRMSKWICKYVHMHDSSGMILSFRCVKQELDKRRQDESWVMGYFIHMVIRFMCVQHANTRHEWQNHESRIMRLESFIQGSAKKTETAEGSTVIWVCAAFPISPSTLNESSSESGVNVHLHMSAWVMCDESWVMDHGS